MAYTKSSGSGEPDLPSIKVVGVGGGGGNAVSRMMGKIRGVEFVAVNTDLQDLAHTRARRRIPIGKALTKGRGAGMDPEVGRRAAEENRDEILKAMTGAELVFVTCGLGGGTGSGAAPVVADCAREAGALAVAVVTKPFVFEGTQRKRIAEDAWRVLAGKVDAIITVPNDRVFNVISRNTRITEAFQRIDDILRQAVQGIADLISRPGLINVDFADIKTIMTQSGPAILGIGVASGSSRAADAATAAIQSPLLDISIDGARGVLFNVSGRESMGMAEVNEVAKLITESVDPEARIIFGATFDPRLRAHELKVTVIAAGFGSQAESLFRREQQGPIASVPRKVSVTEVAQPAERVKLETPVLTNSNNNALKELLEKKGGAGKELETPAFFRRKRK